MTNPLQKLLLTAASLAVGVMILKPHAAQAYSFSFSQVFDSGEKLTGSFAGSDKDGNGTLEANEFSLFSSQFEGLENDFKFFSLGLENLSPLSFFTSPDDYSFIVTDVASDRGWKSYLEPGDSGATIVGFAPSSDNVSGRYFAQEPLKFEATPEPMSMAGLLLTGLGMVAVSRRQHGSQKVS